MVLVLWFALLAKSELTTSHFGPGFLPGFSFVARAGRHVALRDASHASSASFVKTTPVFVHWPSDPIPRDR
jgi:hypothetical protein